MSAARWASISGAYNLGISPAIGSRWRLSVPGSWKIRVRVDGAYRLMYAAKFVEGIYVLHVFQKKLQKTSGLDIDLARARLAALLRTRKEK